MKRDYAEQQTDGTWIAYGRNSLGETGSGPTREMALADLRRQRANDASYQSFVDAEEAGLDAEERRLYAGG